MYLFGFLIFGNLADNALNPRSFLLICEIGMAVILFLEVFMIATDGIYAQDEHWVENTESVRHDYESMERFSVVFQAGI